MPYHRRNKKRHRNKSSPQIVSSPKKYRQSTVDCEDSHDESVISEVESESELEYSANSANSVMGPGELSQVNEQSKVEVVTGVVDVDTTTATTATSVPSSDKSMSSISHTSASQQLINGMPQFPGGLGPSMMFDNNMMQGAPPMAPQMAFNPQQMLNFAQPMAHPQPPQMPQLPQMPQYPG